MVIELDTMKGGDDLQLGLQEVTGRRTVPQVFVGGQHVGGCDDTVAAYQNGKLKEMLAGLGFSI
ncbi:thioredoxin-like protein [Scenedesmus sp. NREL 46B-D3]|nr:thioredoxin-like protein [Scenedesmus sp. NREL 46B-D3]